MWFFITVLSLFFILFLYFNIAQSIKMQKRFRLLYHDCDPVQFLADTEKDLSKYGRKGENRFTGILKFDKVLGLIYSGKFKQAFGLLKEFRPDKLPKRLQVIYYNHLVIIYLNIKGLKETDKIMQEQKELFAYNKMDNKLKVTVKCRLAQYEYYKGDYLSSKEYLQELTDIKTPRLYRCEAFYFLGLIEYKLGNNEKARELLQKAHELSGKTYIEREIAGLLKNL